MEPRMEPVRHKDPLWAPGPYTVWQALGSLWVQEGGPTPPGQGGPWELDVTFCSRTSFWMTSIALDTRPVLVTNFVSTGQGLGIFQLILDIYTGSWLGGVKSDNGHESTLESCRAWENEKLNGLWAQEAIHPSVHLANLPSNRRLSTPQPSSRPSIRPSSTIPSSFPQTPFAVLCALFLQSLLSQHCLSRAPWTVNSEIKSAEIYYMEYG